MIQIEAQGECFDLYADTRIGFEFINPAFAPEGEGGSFGYPFSLPGTSRNHRLTGFAYMLQKREVLNISIPAKISVFGLPIADGILKLTHPVSEESIKVFTVVNTFADLVKDRSLRTVDYGGSQAFSAIGNVPADFMNARVMPGSDSFAFYPSLAHLHQNPYENGFNAWYRDIVPHPYVEHIYYLSLFTNHCNMKRIILSLLFLLIGLFFGGSWAMFSIQSIGKKGGFAQQNGNWSFNPSMDLEADDFQRAVIGKIGLFALRESEVLYYLATKDSEGRSLSSKYKYQLDGQNFEARYWSYTLYGEDHFLIPNEAKIHSLNLENIDYSDSTKWAYTLFISKNKNNSNWLPSGEAENMSVLLRMYNPDTSIYENMDQVELPEIVRIGS